MREKIIDTAIEEFTRNGLKFTMNDVAKALGISKKTIYTVFESKQDVLMAIADRYARDFTDMRQEIEADTELDTLESWNGCFAQFRPSIITSDLAGSSNWHRSIRSSIST